MSRPILFTLSLFLLLAACTNVDATPTAVVVALRVTAVPPTHTALPTYMATTPGELTPTVFPVTRNVNLEEYDLSTSIALSPTKLPTSTPTATPPPTVTPAYTPAVLHPLAISLDNVEEIVEVTQLGKGTIHKMVLSPDGEVVAIVGGLGVWLYDLDTLELIQFIDQPHMVNAADWSPNGTRLVWGGEDNMVHVWNFATDEELLTWNNFASAIWSLSWSQDGKYVVVGTVTGDLWVWQADTGELISQFGMSEYGRVWGISWAPDNVRFASAHRDGMVRIWDVHTGSLLSTFEAHHIPDTYYGGATIYHGVLSVAWSPDGQFIASSGSDDQKVRIWYADSGEEFADLLISSIHTAHSMAWSPDGTRLALGSGWGSIALLNITTLNADSFFDKHAKAVHSLTWLPDGSRVISASIDTIKTGIPGQVLSGYTEPVQSLAWSPDNRFLATGNTDVQIWDVASETIVQTFISPENYRRLDSLAWSPNGSKLAWAEGEYGGAARTWDVTTGQFIERTKDGWGFGDAENGVFQVGWTSDDLLLVSPWERSDWSPDNSLIAVERSSEIYIYDMQTGETHLLLPGHEAVTLAVTWSPDGKWIASSGSHDYAIRVWDAATGAEQIEIVGSVIYNKLIWSPDTTLLLGVSGNQIFIWETANGQEIRRIDLGSDVLSVAISPDGRILAIGSADGTVHLWSIP